MKNCKQCNKEFKPRFGTETFCSRKCYADARKTTRIKTECGYCCKELEIKRAEFREHGRHFCSRECYYNSMIIHELETRVCIVCGEEYEAMSWKKNKHCSTDCSNITNGKNRMTKRLKNLKRELILWEKNVNNVGLD